MLKIIIGIIVGVLIGITLMALIIAGIEDEKDYELELYRRKKIRLNKWLEINKRNIKNDFDKGYKDGLEYAVVLMKWEEDDE